MRTIQLTLIKTLFPVRIWNLRTLRSLHHRNFRLLLEGALISSSGDFMQNVAQSWLVWHLSKSPVAIGVIAVFDTLPRLLIGALGGAIADRFDRRRVLMITQTLAMSQAIVYWFLVEFEAVALWHVAILAFFLGVVNTINQTARQSLVNSLVPKEQLLNAIGLQSSVFNFSKIVGPSAGGLIIAYVGVAACFLVNAISFVFLLFNLYLMELPAREPRRHQLSLFFMDRGLWSLGGLMIGASASAIGIDWTFATCSVVCATAATSLLVLSRRQREATQTQAARALWSDSTKNK